jgi:hypothetical protein
VDKTGLLGGRTYGEFPCRVLVQLNVWVAAMMKHLRPGIGLAFCSSVLDTGRNLTVLAWNKIFSESCSRLARDLSARHENDRIMHKLHNVGRLFIARRRWHLMRDLYSVKLLLEIHGPGATAEYNSVPFGFFGGLLLSSSFYRVYCYFRVETWNNTFSRLEIWPPTRAMLGGGKL